MSGEVLLDTGPLVAFLNRRDRYHAWAAEQLAGVDAPLLTCESVLSEAWTGGWMRCSGCWSAG